MRVHRSVIFVILGIPLFLFGCKNGSAQRGDLEFVPVVARPAFPPGQGPHLALDEGHTNYHTLTGRFKAFGDLARADGFVVTPSRGSFNPDSLSGIDVLVIANALNPRNAEDWSLPTPSAFSPDEITAVRDWVEAGGALLLIADHMPFPGAAHDLAEAFGFKLNNGFAGKQGNLGSIVFKRGDGTLATHAVTDGRSQEERIDSVVSFTGEAFKSPPGATDLLTFPEGFVSLMPEVAWEFNKKDTPSIDVAGWSQGSVMEFGQGRVAVFGEAAMFTAQRVGAKGRPVGMNAPIAKQNQQFATNLIRWLAKVD